VGFFGGFIGFAPSEFSIEEKTRTPWKQYSGAAREFLYQCAAITCRPSVLGGNGTPIPHSRTPAYGHHDHHVV
jgi:hypothetical protein